MEFHPSFFSYDYAIKSEVLLRKIRQIQTLATSTLATTRQSAAAVASTTFLSYARA